MADFCDDFESWIRARSRITDIIGSGTSCKVYPDVPPQWGLRRFLVYAESGGESEEHLSGGAGMCHAVVQVWSYGDTRKEANQLAEIVKEELRPLRGMMGTTHVSEVSCAKHRDYGVEGPQDGGNKYRYWTRRIFDIWHQETT